MSTLYSSSTRLSRLILRSILSDSMTHLPYVSETQNRHEPVVYSNRLSYKDKLIAESRFSSKKVNTLPRSPQQVSKNTPSISKPPKTSHLWNATLSKNTPSSPLLLSPSIRSTLKTNPPQIYKSMASEKAIRKETETAGVHEQAEKASRPKDELKEQQQTEEQNPAEAIRAAEERYEKTKQSGAAALGATKDAAMHGLSATAAYAAGKGAEAKDAASHGARVAAEYVSEKGSAVKDYGAEKAQQAVEKGQQGLHAAKDSAVSAGQKAADTTLHTAEQAKDFVLEKAQQAKDVTVSTGRSAMDFTSQKAVETKDVVVNTGHSAVEYAGHKAVEAKDGTLSTGQKAIDYVRDKSSEIKEKVGEQRQAAQEEQTTSVEHGKDDKRQLLKSGEQGDQRSKNGEAELDENVQVKKNDVERVQGILDAVGGTLIDIVLATKDLIMGLGTDQD